MAYGSESERVVVLDVNLLGEFRGSRVILSHMLVRP